MMFFNRKSKARQLIKFHNFWEMDDQQISSSFQKLWERIEQLPPSLELPQPAFNRWKFAAIAASIAILVVCGLSWFIHTRPVERQVEIAYIADKATQISLSDGTNVWLSAHSQLRYQQTFTGKTRDVVLDGEAYFEVVHNSEQPFRVLTGDQTVEVLGTSFNVRAYAEEQNVKVALVEGGVRVTDDKSRQTVMLKPAQEAVIVKSSGSIAVNSVNLDILMSWKTGRYVFKNMTFENIAKTLEKGFKVTILIENETLKRKPYNMRFENGESLERILDLIQVNAKYTYQYNNGIIVIK